MELDHCASHFWLRRRSLARESSSRMPEVNLCGRRGRVLMMMNKQAMGNVEWVWHKSRCGSLKCNRYIVYSRLGRVFICKLSSSVKIVDISKIRVISRTLGYAWIRIINGASWLVGSHHLRASLAFRETESSQSSSSHKMAAGQRFGIGKSLRVSCDLGSSRMSLTRGSSPGRPKVSLALVYVEELSRSYRNRDRKCWVQ